MAGNDAHITITGNVGADPDIKFTPDGVTVANFPVGVTPRRLDKSTNEWVDDGDTMWFRVTAWRRDAEACAETINKGMPVRVSGTFRVRPYETKDGRSGVGYEVTADRGGVTMQVTVPRRNDPPVVEDPWT